jgi:ABC-2 type transport system permease protein
MKVRTKPGHPLWELTLARLLEFWRSPATIFWVFGFPVVLAVVLGIAFREKGEQSYRAAVPEATLEEQTEQDNERYIDFLLPGLIGMNMMSSCMWGIGYAIVDSRKRKLLKRFAATPMNRAHYLLSFMFSRLLFLILEVGLLLLFGWLVFDVSVNGSLLAIWGIAVLGAMTFSGMSVLVASRTDSTEVASGWMNLIMMPMWLFSGAFFDYHRFPEIAHPFIRMLPLTAVNDSLRALVNDGSSLFTLGVELLVLVMWGGISFFLALRLFRWQ